MYDRQSSTRSSKAFRLLRHVSWTLLRLGVRPVSTASTASKLVPTYLPRGWMTKARLGVMGGGICLVGKMIGPVFEKHAGTTLHAQFLVSPLYDMITPTPFPFPFPVPFFSSSLALSSSSSKCGSCCANTNSKSDHVTTGNTRRKSTWTGSNP
jgi:hypothetical protein